MKTSQWKWASGIIIRLVTTIMRSNRAPFIIPFILTPAIIKPRCVRVRTVNCDTSVQIPQFLSLFLISDFQDLRNQFSKFYPCTNLWHFWKLWIFLRTCLLPYLPCSCFCQHSWTMTCSVYLSCHYLCVVWREHCSLFENELHRTWDISWLDDPFPLPDAREFDCVNIHWIRPSQLVWNRGSSNETSPPHMFDFQTHPGMFASETRGVSCVSPILQSPMPPELDLIVQCVLLNFSRSGTRGIPIVRSLLGVPTESTFRKDDPAKQISFSSSCRRVSSFLQSSPSSQQVLPRVGDNAISLITRESHQRCVHLLQHELQIAKSSLYIRWSGQKLQIYGCRRDSIVEFQQLRKFSLTQKKKQPHLLHVRLPDAIIFD